MTEQDKKPRREGRGGGRRPFAQREKPEFDQTIVDLARVTRVTKGGKQMSFRVCLVIGDRNGRVGFGVEKGSDVQIATGKALAQAKKNMIRVPLIDGTIPHRVEAKYKAGHVMLKPAPQGSGIIAGSAVRTVLELAGVQNASGKMLGKTNNKIVNVKTTFDALQRFLPRAVARAKKAAPTIVAAPTTAETEAPVAPAAKAEKKAARPRKTIVKANE